jgi:hypothetical protein
VSGVAFQLQVAIFLIQLSNPPRHKSMLEYLHANNFQAAYNALKSDTRMEYTPDPKAKYVGLLEKKWTSVIRLQKKVKTASSLARLNPLDLSVSRRYWNSRIATLHYKRNSRNRQPSGHRRKTTGSQEHQLDMF